MSILHAEPEGSPPTPLIPFPENQLTPADEDRAVSQASIYKGDIVCDCSDPLHPRYYEKGDGINYRKLRYIAEDQVFKRGRKVYGYDLAEVLTVLRSSPFLRPQEESLQRIDRGRADVARSIKDIQTPTDAEANHFS